MFCTLICFFIKKNSNTASFFDRAHSWTTFILFLALISWLTTSILNLSLISPFVNNLHHVSCIELLCSQPTYCLFFWSAFLLKIFFMLLAEISVASNLHTTSFFDLHFWWQPSSCFLRGSFSLKTSLLTLSLISPFINNFHHISYVDLFREQPSYILFLWPALLKKTFAMHLVWIFSFVNNFHIAFVFDQHFC